jgi:hypothetical protein
MKKNYLIALLTLFVSFANAQRFIESTSYRGAFAPTGAMWTDQWTNYDPKNEPYLDAATVVNVTADITANTTWTTGKTYKLAGLIYVRNNATLTIQPGVVVKGLSSVNGTALIVTKGSKLNAIGTAAAPIVFTSGKTVAQGRQPGDWGGIILLGKAGFNANIPVAGQNGVNNIEGITANINTEYGGGTTAINNDNSGTLKYVRIEFGGYVFSPNNEINGLTMGAVGNGTTIDYVQVSYTNDDAFEWFGGSVNCKHLVSFRNLDDDFDTDNGYKGIVQFGLIVRDPSIADNPSVSTSESFESDNNAAGTASASGYDSTSAIFTNITSVGPSKRATLSPTTSLAVGHERALRLRRATQLKVFNSIFMDFKSNILFVDGTLAVGNANAGTLKFINNIMAGAVGTTFTAGINPTSLNSWFSTNGNSLQASSDGILATPYNAITNSYLNLDYRPATGSAALSNANFTDSAIVDYVITPVNGDTPLVSNVTYCKGAVAAPLTATLTAGNVSLRWYANATTATFTTSAPATPSTSPVFPVGQTQVVTTYYVAQVNAAGIASDRVSFTVTVNALPTEVISTITGAGPAGSTSATEIGRYVGTTSQFTYTVTPFTGSGLTYVWTLPLGVNLVSGGTTNSITVNFANVPFGAGSVGSIQVQAQNASGCRTAAKTLALTKVLPAAPTTVIMTDKASSTPATAVTSYAKYMGTTTPLTLTAAAVVAASTYEWELPAGVTISIPAGTPAPVTTTVNYTAEPFFSPSTGTLPLGTRFWTVTNNAYTIDVNGVSTTITVSTCAQRYQGSSNNTPYPSTSAPYLQYGTVVRSNLPSILVNFAGVTNPATTALYFGVRSLNGVGYSITANATNADVVANRTGIPGLFNTTYTATETLITPPGTQGSTTYTVSGFAPKTSKLLKLVAAIPAAPAALKLTNPAAVLPALPTTAITDITKYIGTSTPLTLTATPSATAQSYDWILPNGVTQVSGTNTNVIEINFANFDPADLETGTFATYLECKARNIIGVSTTNNSAASVVPATSSTAKLLKVTATRPAAPTTLAMKNGATAITNVTAFIGTTTPLTLTAGVSPLATSYSWELPVGAVQLTGDNTNIITFDLSGVVQNANTLKLDFGVKAVNRIGASITSNSTLSAPTTTSTAKILRITNTVPTAVTTVGGPITAISCGTAYNYTITASPLAKSYTITGPVGSVVTSASNPANATNVLSTSNVAFSVVYPSNLATLAAKTLVITSVNGFGNSTTNKTLTITPATIAAVGTIGGGSTFSRTSNKTITIPAVVGATNYTWTVVDGAAIVSGQGTTSIVVNFAEVPSTSSTNVVSVVATNNCGVNTPSKSITLTAITARSIEEVDTVAFSNISVYPNPASYEMNIDIDATNVGDVQMSIYTLNGILVMKSKTINLVEGRNTISENISNLTNGLYIVRLVDASNKEVMVKKLIKN